MLHILLHYIYSMSQAYTGEGERARGTHIIEFRLCSRSNLIFTTILSAPFTENKFIDHTLEINTNASATNTSHNLNAHTRIHTHTRNKSHNTQLFPNFYFSISQTQFKFFHSTHSFFPMDKTLSKFGLLIQFHIVFNVFDVIFWFKTNVSRRRWSEKAFSVCMRDSEA